jgi:hypothetical protein
MGDKGTKNRKLGPAKRLTGEKAPRSASALVGDIGYDGCASMQENSNANEHICRHENPPRCRHDAANRNQCERGALGSAVDGNAAPVLIVSAERSPRKRATI